MGSSLPVLLLLPLLVWVEVTVIGALGISKVTLGATLLMMRVLLQATNTPTDARTPCAVTKPVASVEALSLRSALSALSLALSLWLALALLHCCTTSTCYAKSGIFRRIRLI